MASKVSNFVQDALYRKCAGVNASQAVIWASVNSLIVSILLYDLSSKGLSREFTLLWWLAVGLCILCSFNIVCHLRLYFLPHFAISPLEVNEKQRKLLSVSDNDVGFKSPSETLNTSTPTPERSWKLSELYKSTIRTPPPPHQSMNATNLASGNKMWYSDMYGSPNSSAASNITFSPVPEMGRSLNASSVSPSITANSWTFHRNQSSMLNSSYNVIASPKRNLFGPSEMGDSFLLRKSPQATSSPLNSTIPLTSSPIPLGKENPISTKDELDSYLKEFNDKERKKLILSQSEISNGSSNPLWAYSSGSGSNYDFSSLRQNVYQPAVKDEGIDTNSSLSKIDDAKRPYYSSLSVSKIWLKRNVSPKDLFKYEENLRIWLAMNILQPLIQLIDSCNEALTAVAPEVKVGNVGVDKLRKAAQNISGIKQLNYLLPFLDVTVHQDYLVHRLRELSKGGAISAFLWNAGGTFNGNQWRDEYPTDTYILLHLFSMYMDNHLPPDPTQPDGRVFSNIHVVKTPEKPTLPTTHPCLYLTQINPPHLKVVLPPDEECEVGGGHKNCFHALILFCHHLVHQQHSHIAGVDLNLSGINLAWVVNAE